MVDGAKYTMACGCGAVEMEAHGAPVASCYCHCDNCREARKVNAFAGVPFAPENITFGKGEQSLRVVEPFAGNPDRDHMKNYTCPACGVVMYNTSIFGLRVIALDLVTKANGGAVPSELQPTVHLNYVTGSKMLRMTCRNSLTCRWILAGPA